MDSLEIVRRTKQLIEGMTHMSGAGAFAQAAEFLRVYGGPKNSFLSSLQKFAGSGTDNYTQSQTLSTMSAFLAYVEAGLMEEVSPERKAQLDVVSDFLEQAQALLETKGVHPAAPAVIIGATLEEFLRTWVEAQGLSLGNRKSGLETYMEVLREADLISKQDAKDITAWGGIRNHAAHGDWSEVDDKKRVQLMLEGVNLFMRKYSGPKLEAQAAGAPTPHARIQNI